MSPSLPQIHADRMRVAVLDTNGVPLPSGAGIYVTDALTKLTIKPKYTDGDLLKEPNASGGFCLNYQEDDTFDGLDVDIELCTPDPWLSQMLAGGTLLTEVSAGVPGYAFPKIGRISGAGVSIEVWAKRIDNDDLDEDFPYAWWAITKLKRAKIGDKAFEKAMQASVFSGRAVENSNWFDGPANDWPDASDRVLQWVPATTLPALTPDGPVALPAS